MKAKLGSLVKRFTWLDWLILALLLILLFYLIALGVSASLRKAPVVEYLPASERDGGNSSKRDIWVDVSGAVVVPGVYKLAEGDRVKDALVAAGGFSSTADRVSVSREVNLAAVVTDGQKIYIRPISNEKPAVGRVAGAETSDKINLNTASPGELDGLWGIGQVRAGEIIKNRPYAKIEELLTKKIVTKAVFEKIRDLITAY